MNYYCQNISICLWNYKLVPCICMLGGTWLDFIYKNISLSHVLISTSVYPHLYQLKVKLATIVEDDPKAPFSIATTPRALFLSLDCSTTLDPYLTMLSVKQGGIKHHFLSFWYESTWDWTLVSRAIGKHSNHHANNRLIGLVGRVFTNGTENLGSIPCRVIPKTQKMEGVTPSLTPRCSSYCKGSFRVTLDYSGQLYLLIAKTHQSVYEIPNLFLASVC